MQPREGLFIRPLLDVSKEELKQYMEDQKLTWCEDKSNFERKYTRNLLRLDAIPALASAAGGQAALSRSA